jgi:hypothetical protein
VASPSINPQPIVDRVNYYRLLHSSPAVVWDGRDGEITRVTKAWTENMAVNDIWDHSRYPYGENLGLARIRNPAPTNATSYVIDSIDMWYKEVAFYNYSRPGFSMKTGHFTQLVWRDTKRIAFSASYDTKYMKLYIAMFYHPVGNSGDRTMFSLMVKPCVIVPPAPFVKYDQIYGTPKRRSIPPMAPPLFIPSE